MTEWSAFLFKDKRFLVIPQKFMERKSVGGLKKGPYVLRFHMDDGTYSYFSDNQGTKKFLEDQGKKVYSFDVFVGGLKKRFDAMNIKTNIDQMTIDFIFAHKALGDVFPESRYTKIMGRDV